MVSKGKLRSGCTLGFLAIFVVAAAPSVRAQIPVPRCEELTPTLTVRQASLRCQGGAAESCVVDKWRIRGQFTMFSSPDHSFDPGNQKVTLIFNQVDGELYSPVLQPGTFIGKGSEGRPTWAFRLRRRDPYLEGAEGWRKGKFRHVKLAPAAGAANRVRYTFIGGENELKPFEIDTSGSPILLRETVIFSEPDEEGGAELLCVSYILTCTKHRGDEALRCFSLTNPSASGAFLQVTSGLLD